MKFLFHPPTPPRQSHFERKELSSPSNHSSRRTLFPGARASFDVLLASTLDRTAVDASTLVSLLEYDLFTNEGNSSPISLAVDYRTTVGNERSPSTRITSTRTLLSVQGHFFNIYCTVSRSAPQWWNFVVDSFSIRHRNFLKQPYPERTCVSR